MTSCDVDFLVVDSGDQGPAERMARGLRGNATFPPEPEHALAAIVSQTIRQVSESGA